MIQKTSSIPSVVFLSETLPLGGTTTFVFNICKGMHLAGCYNPVVGVVRGLTDFTKKWASQGIQLTAPQKREALLHEDRMESLFREFAKYSPQVVVAGLSSGSFDFLRYVPDGTIRVGMIQSDDEQVYDLVEQYLPWLDAVAGVSSEICRKMEARLESDSTVAVFHQPYGVPMPERVTERSYQGPLKILYTGRVVEEQKRIKMMARIMKASIEAGLNIEWTIAGDGEDLGSLMESFRNQPKARFLGQVAYDEIHAVIREHDVYFLCSDYEGLPLSLLEAMGEGLVPVVSDLPSGISEVVNDQNGIRLPLHDETAYVDAIAWLDTNRDKLPVMSRNARQEVFQSHSILAMAKRWDAMIKTLRAKKPTIPVWPRSCKAAPPLGVIQRWKFWPIFKPLRRIAKRLQSHELCKNVS